MKIGCHVSNSGEMMLEASAILATSYGANCFMVYMGAPQNTYRKSYLDMHISEMLEILKDHNIDPSDVIVHAPYIVNLAQSDDDKFNYAINFLTNEVILTNHCHLKYMVIHPGAHVGLGYDYGIKRISEGLIKILDNTKDLDVTILLETMSGKGTECGYTFEQIKAILDNVESPRLKVCLDTCHIHDAGYDIINDYEEVIKTFDQIIGINNLCCIHINDSKNPRGSKKDRHENFGFGYIGFNTLMKFINDERFQNIPKILETPYVKDDNLNSYESYKEEIKMIKKGIFNPNLINDIINQ